MSEKQNVPTKKYVEINDDLYLLVIETNITSKVYKGKISILIYPEISDDCPKDIFVLFDPNKVNKKYSKVKETYKFTDIYTPLESKTFATHILETLRDHDKLPLFKYSADLARAEYGMQEQNLAIYEVLFLDGKVANEEFYIKNGADIYI